MIFLYNPLPPTLLWKCVDTDRWQGRLIVIERNRLTGRYRRRTADCGPLHEMGV